MSRPASDKWDNLERRHRLTVLCRKLLEARYDPFGLLMIVVFERWSMGFYDCELGVLHFAFVTNHPNHPGFKTLSPPRIIELVTQAQDIRL
jgi:hypothetical protein